MRNVLVLVFDRLGSAYLGPYGNSWVRTPAWNRLAAQSLLLESAVTDCDDLEAVYGAYWYGRHALCCGDDGGAPAELTSLAALCESAAEVHLVTDEPLVADHVAGEDFPQRALLPAPRDQVLAEAWEETHLGRLVATALETLEAARAPFLIWVHAQAMQGPWDAPHEWRASFADEEDPDPPHWCVPPTGPLPADYDPDHLLGVQHAYAGQVAVLDSCLRVLLDALESGPHAETTLVLATSPRGFPLGEHGVVGPHGNGLYGELTLVPWLARWPDGVGRAVRVQDLVQPADLYATVAHWLQLPVPGASWSRDIRPLAESPDAPRRWDRAVVVSGTQRRLHVPYWAAHVDTDQSARLFVKPDDRWEVNDVAVRCPQVVAEARQVCDEFEQAARDGDWSQVSALPARLAEPTE